MQAAELFEQKIKPVEVARRLRVSRKSAYQWHQLWRDGGVAVLTSRWTEWIEMPAVAVLPSGAGAVFGARAGRARLGGGPSVDRIKGGHTDRQGSSTSPTPAKGQRPVSIPPRTCVPSRPASTTGPARHSDGRPQPTPLHLQDGLSGYTPVPSYASGVRESTVTGSPDFAACHAIAAG
ncbi:helix-turn-helix domain-containing protein [Streptomyces sp. NPDC056254]|uniref:helix-turn-helix domain-containing protein n=1 Tax=Streptomyces sp. NPDC056254 TaxID=3345763 RepID=UPI0035DEFE02